MDQWTGRSVWIPLCMARTRYVERR
jgi:hypothetical protein